MIAAAGNDLFELDSKTGDIWQYNGTPCGTSGCKGWTLLDDNPLAMQIASDGTNLYELHGTGSIFKYTGTPCNGSSCTGWQQLDDNGATGRIAAGLGQLYQIHQTVIPPSRSIEHGCYECR
jgi:hypothetical protein